MLCPRSPGRSCRALFYTRPPPHLHPHTPRPAVLTFAFQSGRRGRLMRCSESVRRKRRGDNSAIGSHNNNHNHSSKRVARAMMMTILIMTTRHWVLSTGHRCPAWSRRGLYRVAQLSATEIIRLISHLSLHFGTAGSQNSSTMVTQIGVKATSRVSRAQLADWGALLHAPSTSGRGQGGVISERNDVVRTASPPKMVGYEASLALAGMVTTQGRRPRPRPGLAIRGCQTQRLLHLHPPRPLPLHPF